MDDDSAMLIPQNRNPSTGRAGTPSKKTATPTKIRTGSAPRASSGGGGGSARGSAAVQLAVKRCVTAAPNRAISRSGQISTRKQRKWELDHLFGISKEASRAMFGADGFDYDDDGNIKNFGLTVDWRCLFSELFRSQNEQARVAFLSCADCVQETPKLHTRFSKLSEDLKAGEMGWSRVPKRLRPVLQRAIEVDSDVLNSELGPIEYIRALESVIFYFIDTGFAAPVATLPAALHERLAEPIKLKEAPVCGRKERNNSEDEDGWIHVEADDAASSNAGRHMGLEIVLEDSALHRLFLHAIVQFHGLQTRSFDSDGQRCDNGIRQQKKNQTKKGNGPASKIKVKPCLDSPSLQRKAILIYRGKAALSVIPSANVRLSLVSFLQYKQTQK